MTKRLHSTRPTRDRAYLVGVELPRAGFAIEESLGELAELAGTAGAIVVGQARQRARKPNVATYIGSGKVEAVVADARRLDANTIIFDDELSPSQQRNLEEASGVKVLDRTALILDIFAQRASSREGRLQVGLAQAEYLLPRLRGQWQHLERMEGAIGLRGPGETQIETDRRLVRRRIQKLKRDLDRVRAQREQHRQRRRRSGSFTVALVGYTNAGKSTLMQALTSAERIAADKLFATLDPLTRRMRLPEGGEVLLTDTVGFIQKLPSQLVAAFRATLEELDEADLLLHVVDISHAQAAQQSETVEETLALLGLADVRRITVLNKIDALVPGEAAAAVDELVDSMGEIPVDTVHVSALTGWGCETLLHIIAGAAAARPGTGGPPQWKRAG